MFLLYLSLRGPAEQTVNRSLNHFVCSWHELRANYARCPWMIAGFRNALVIFVFVWIGFVCDGCEVLPIDLSRIRVD
jgi:hypothetical protein